MEKKLYFWSPKSDKNQGERQYENKHNNNNKSYIDGDQALTCLFLFLSVFCLFIHDVPK